MVIESLGYFSDFFYYFSYFTSLFYYLPCFAGFSHELVEIPHCSTGFFHNLLCFTDIFHDPVELLCRSAGLFHELVELFKWLIHGHICTPPLSFLQFSLPDTCSVAPSPPCAPADTRRLTACTKAIWTSSRTCPFLSWRTSHTPHHCHRCPAPPSARRHGPARLTPIMCLLWRPHHCCPPARSLASRMARDGLV